MNKNTLIGVGVIGLGVLLAVRAKRQGKVVPIIGKYVPTGK